MCSGKQGTTSMYVTANSLCPLPSIITQPLRVKLALLSTLSSYPHTFYWLAWVYDWLHVLYIVTPILASACREFGCTEHLDYFKEEEEGKWDERRRRDGAVRASRTFWWQSENRRWCPRCERLCAGTVPRHCGWSWGGRAGEARWRTGSAGRTREIKISQTKHSSLTLLGVNESCVHLREERPLVLELLDAVGHQPFHGFGAGLVELTQVWGQVSSSHHEDNLRGGVTQRTDETQGVQIK